MAGVNPDPNLNSSVAGLAYAPLYPGVHVIGVLGGDDLTASPVTQEMLCRKITRLLP